MVLSLLWTVIWVTLLAVGGLVLLLLLMPWSLSVDGVADDDEGIYGEGNLRWGLGLLALRLGAEGLAFRVLGITVHRRSWRQLTRRKDGKKKRRADKKRVAKKRRDEPEADEPETGRRRGPRWVMARRRFLWRVARSYLRTLHVRGRIRGVVGLRDPGHTAVLSQVLSEIESRLPEGALDVELDWIEEVVSLRGRLGLWIWPVEVVGLTVVWALNWNTWRALRA